MNALNRSGARIATALFLIGAVALPSSLVVPRAIEQRAAVAFGDDAIRVTLGSPGFGPSRWRLDNPRSPLRSLPPADDIAWADHDSFALAAGRAIERHFDARRIHSSAIVTVGKCIVFEPSALCPAASHARTRWECEVRCDGVARMLPLSNDAAESGVAGEVVALTTIGTGGNIVRVVATEARAVSTAEQLAAIVAAIAEKYGALNTAPLTLIAGCEGGELSSMNARNRFASNLFLGPFAERSELLRWRVAGLLVAKSAEAANLSGDRSRAAICAVVGDLLQTRVFGGVPALCGDLAERRLVVTAANLGMARPTWLEQLGVVPEAEERQGVEIDAPLLVAHALERSPGGTDPSAAANTARESGAWIRATIEALRRVPPPEPMARIDAILQEFSAVEPSAPASPSAEPSVHFEFSSGLFGFLEDCGCKVAAGGGLKRILARWGADHATFHVLLGDALALPGRGNFVPRLNAFVVDLLRDVGAEHLDAFVPGEAELYAIADGSAAADAFAPLHATACNVESPSGERTFLPFVDVKTADGRPMRVVGVCELDPTTFGRREYEVVGARFRFTDVGAAVARIVAATDAGVPIVVCGMIDAKSLRSLACLAGRRALVFSGASRTPRTAPSGRSLEQFDGAIAGTPVRFDRVFNYGVQVVTWDLAASAVAESLFLVDPAPPEAPAVLRVNQFLNDDGGAEEPSVQFREDMLATNASYVGTRRCAECHAEQFTQWRTTHHSQAMKSLQAVQRHRAPGCVQCHVVGFGLPTGYELATDDLELRNVGCEVCHGPGSRHVDAPRDRSAIRRDPPDDLCSQCHSEKHSFFLSGNQPAFRAEIRH